MTDIVTITHNTHARIMGIFCWEFLDSCHKFFIIIGTNLATIRSTVFVLILVTFLVIICVTILDTIFARIYVTILDTIFVRSQSSCHNA